MIENKSNWVLAFCAALIVHVIIAAVFLLHSTKIDTGAVAKGQQGVQVDLGMMGDLGKFKQKKAAPKAEKTPPKPVEPEPKPEPKIEEPPKPKQVSPVVIKKPEKKKVKKKTHKKKVKKKTKVTKVNNTEKSTKKVTQASSETGGTDAVNQGKVSTGVGNASTSGGQRIAAKRSYEGMLLALLLKQKRYPQASVRRGEEGIVTLFFKLDKTGKVVSYSIAKSSGHRRLDKEVLRMIEGVKFPPFLPTMTQNSLSVTVPISFKLVSD